MLPGEAKWIRAQLEPRRLEPGATVVDVGSQGVAYRNLTQPYIEHDVFRPLRERGVRVVHADATEQEGVDVVVDVTAPSALPPALAASADVAICASLLAHVTDRAAAIETLGRIVKPDGLAIVASPRRYPKTPAPIDTGYRPTPAELAADLEPWFEVERQELVASPPNNLLVPDGPAHRLVLWTGRQLAARIVRRRRMPPTCLVSAVVARRPATPQAA
jgi:SAM-dependent methyltransferase